MRELNIRLVAPDGWGFAKEEPALAMPGEYFWGGFDDYPVQQSSGFHKWKSYIMEPLDNDALVLRAGAQVAAPVGANDDR